MPQPSLRSRARQSSADARLPPGRRLTQIAFVLSVALVVCRLLMPEAIRSPVDALASLSAPQPAHVDSQGQNQSAASPAEAHAGHDPGPATGLVLDLLFCVPALLVLARRAVDVNYTVLACGSMLPMALLAILAVISPLWAADRFASLVSASHFFCAMVFLWSTVQVVRSWRHLRLIAGMLVGLLIALSLAGYNFRISELPVLRDTFNSNKTAILIQHNFKPDTFEAKMFENRILQGQPMGYRASPNTYAALLVMLGLVAAGVIVQRRADGDHWAWILVPLLATAATLPLIRWTQCRAAYATPVLGALILLALAPLRRWLARHFRLAWFTGVGIVAAGAAFVIFHGMRHGSLWHESLTFRWHYWIGSFRILTDGFYHAARQYAHFFFGVGWENFGPHYLGQRLAIAPEEIRDPHNFAVRVFVELGMIGGILLIAWMLWLWWDLTRPAVVDAAAATELSGAESGAARSVSADAPHASLGVWQTLLPLGIIAFTAIALNIAAATDFSAGSAVIILEFVRGAIFFIVLLGGLMVAALRISGHAIGRPLRDVQFEHDRRPAHWLIYAMLAALATFLVHNLIEFSLFEPGPMFLFALMSGAVLSMRAMDRRQTMPAPALQRSFSMRAARIAWVAAVFGWLAAAAFVVTPVVMAESLAHDADDDILRFAETRDPRLGMQAAREMSEAAHLIPFNADYAHRAAACLNFDGSDPQRVKQMMDAAIAADFMSVRDFHTRAQFSLYRLHDPDGGLADYRHAVMLDPRNVRMRLEFADALVAIARQTHNAKLAKEAALQYECALDDNNQLAPQEVKRLNPQEMERARSGKSQAQEIAR
jgi:hypothetical protein